MADGRPNYIVLLALVLCLAGKFIILSLTNYTSENILTILVTLKIFLNYYL